MKKKYSKMTIFYNFDVKIESPSLFLGQKYDLLANILKNFDKIPKSLKMLLATQFFQSSSYIEKSIQD